MRIVLLGLIAALGLSGCASAPRADGPTETLAIRSVPEGASVRIVSYDRGARSWRHEDTCIAPCAMQIVRRAEIQGFATMPEHHLAAATPIRWKRSLTQGHDVLDPNVLTFVFYPN